MARIPDEVIEQLKRETNLVALIERQGHRFKPHGKDQVTRCPFHEDDTPSLVVSPDTNLWHCMGACQAGGSVIDWVMKTEGCRSAMLWNCCVGICRSLAAPSQNRARRRSSTRPSPN